MNKLKSSKILFVLSVLLVLIMVGSASAADEAGNETVSTSTGVDALSQEVDSVDEKVSAADTNEVGSKDTNSTLLSSTDNEILKASSKSLSELDTLIKVTPNKLVLNDDYKYNGSVLIINKNNMIIDFNNHTLDANGYMGTVLTINANNVTIKNMKFIKGEGTIISKNIGKIYTPYFDMSDRYAATATHYYGENFAVLWNGDSGKLDNCTFTNNNVVIEWVGNNGILNNSIFKDSRHEQLKATGLNFKLQNTNITDITRMATKFPTSRSQHNYKAEMYVGYGVSVSSGSVDQCVFENAGELTFQGSADLSLTNSNFTNTEGYLTLGGITKNCTFDNIKLPAERDYHWGPLFVADFENEILEDCTFKNINTNGQKDSFICLSVGGSMKNLKFISNDFYVFSTNSEIPLTYCLFENNRIRYTMTGKYEGYYASVTKTYRNTYYDHCAFINNRFDQGYIQSVDGSVRIYDSIFINNTATNSLFVHNSGNLIIKNSTFSTNNENKDGWAVLMNSASRVLSLDDLTVFNNKTRAAISPSNYNSDLYPIVYVNQTGGGDGLSPDNRTKLSTALLSMLETGGIIDFENNGLPYTDIGSFTISVPVTLRGNGAVITKNSRIFTITSSHVTIEDFIFLNCKSNDYAPIVYSTGTSASSSSVYFLNIKDCIFIGNTGKNAGVLTNILITGSKTFPFGLIITIDNCEFYNNVGTTSTLYSSYVNPQNKGYFGGAGAIMIAGTSIFVNNSVFDNNQGVNVGAINTFDSKVVVENCNFTNNHGTYLNINTENGGYGGYNSAGAIVLHATDKNSYIKNCTFENNTSPQGGALYMQGSGFGTYTNGYGPVGVYDSIFIGNNATTSEGGAIYIKSNDALIDNCTFNHNNALSGDGAAIYLDGNKLNIIDSRFDGNNAKNNVIGITTSLISSLSSDGSVSLVDSNFTNSSCRVIDLKDLSGSIDGCLFEDNKNGCIYIDTGVSGQTLTVTDSNFTNNSADIGSAIYSPVKISISGSRFIGNNASDYAGAVFIGKNALSSSILYSEFINNSAVSHGGALFIGADNVMIRNSEFRNNSANSSTLGGGAIFDDGDVMIIINSIMTGNRADSGYGGGIYINTTGKGTIYYSVDKFTRNTYTNNYCLNHTLEPTDESWNDTYDGNAVSLLDTVYVVLNPELWIINGNKSSADGESWENATWLGNALTIVAPYGQIIFVNGTGEIYNSTNCRLQDSVVTFDKISLSFCGNNTTFTGIRFIINELADSFKLYNSTFINNNDSCIVWKSTDGLINNCTFKDNTASGDHVKGLGVQALADGLSIVDSKFVGNVIDGNCDPGEGAMLYVNASDVNITYCTFDDNHANYGSHIIISSECEHILIEYCEFINGTGIDSYGHAIVIDGGMDVRIKSSNFTSNNLRDTGSYNGGAIIVNYINYLEIDDCRFENNSASSNGGAISFTASSSLVRIDSSMFIGNYLSGYTIQSTGDHYNGSCGGAIYSPLTVFDSFTGNYFINNNASYGGAIYVNNGGKLIITSVFLNNSALNGSAIYSVGDMLNVRSSSFAAPKYNQTNNKLVGYIYSTGNVTFDNVTLSFTDLDHLIKNQTSGSTVDLGFNYLYFNDYDGNFVDGVVINKTLIIDGNGFTLDGNNSVRVFNISSSVELRDLIIVNGNHTLGGAIYSTADLKLNNVTFKNNRAVKGSAIYIVNSTSHWDNSRFEGNDADNATVYFDGNSTVYSKDLTFTGNTVRNGLNVVGTDRIRSPVFYVNNTGIGFGIIPSERTTLTYALNNVLPNGVIYIDGDCDINETIKLNHFVNVTFVGNLTSFRKGDKVDKYLFIHQALNENWFFI